MNVNIKPVLAAVTALVFLGGCDMLRGRERPTTPTVGERVPVLGNEGEVAVDPALADLPVSIPGPYVNNDWAQSGGNASKNMIHVALAPAPAVAWTASIGDGASTRGRLAAEPIVADGRVYTIDTRARVRAFAADTGGMLWERQVRGENSPSETLYGGGLAYENGRIYATNGAGDAAALDAATGNVVWLVKPGGPLRGAPTAGVDTVYVMSMDNQLYALDVADGRTRWNGAGLFELANVFGIASPAFAQSTVVAGYASGELTAYRYENGQVVWQDALARTGISTVVGTISDIDADPVIDNGRVFAVGQGGRMVAVELITGQRAWEINIAGISTPWVAGDWVFVVTDRAQLLAIARASGRIRWISQLPRYRDEEDRQGQIFWRGPVLAGGRLVLTSSEGHLAYVSPADGSIAAIADMGAPFSLSPVVAGNTLYLLDDTGRVIALR